MIDLDEPGIVAWKPFIFDVEVTVSNLAPEGATEARGFRSPSGAFAVHKLTGYPVAFPWATTHLPSGRRAPGRFASKAGAVMWVESLERLHVDWHEKVPRSRNNNPVPQQIKQAALYGPAFLNAHGVPSGWFGLGGGEDPDPPESWADGTPVLVCVAEVQP